MIEGMYVSGFIVRSLLPYEQESLIYGLFQSRESAHEWASNMTLETVVEPVYTPVFNRG